MDTTLVASLESPQWHRVAGLRPRLRPHVRLQRRGHGDQVWVWLIDANTGRFHRLNRTAYEWVGRLDGRNDLGTLWHYLHGVLGEDAPSQVEVMRLLAQLSEAELITVDALPELETLLRHKRRQNLRRKLSVANPLSFKVPLFDPSLLLNALLPLVRPLFTGWALLAWLMLVSGALAAASPHAAALWAAWRTQATSGEFLLTVWIAYPLVKLLHEFGHAFAVRVWGGEVREMGVHLMLLTPVPYVDASSASQFASRRRRMLVGAVGIMVELALAALALFVWLSSTSSALQQAAMAVLTLCTVSTLLFNGNPLARFDGYHVLCDALETPNLGQRAQAVWRRWSLRALGVPQVASNDTPRTQAWLGLYGVLSFAYRAVVGLAVVHWLHEAQPLLALAAALWMGWGLLLRPAGQLGQLLLLDARLNGRRGGALLRASLVALLAVVALTAVPVPSVTVQEGVVWLPEQAVLRVSTDATLQTLHAVSGARVQEGQLIASLENLELAGERESALARRVQLDVEHFRALQDDPARALGLAAQRDALDEQIARLEQRQAGLTLRAQASGTLVLPRERSQEGHFFAQGRELGYVLVDEPVLIKLALSDAQAAPLADADGRVGSVRVRLADAPLQTLAAQIERRTPGATQTLPSAALGSAHGGPIATDPRDPQGLKTLQPVTVLDVRVPARRDAPIGLRAWVRIEQPAQPLARQAARALRQMFLRSLGAQA